MIIDAVLNNNFRIGDKNVDVINSVCGVIDTIRATTTMTVMLEKGCSEILISRSKTEALKLRRFFPGYILCGEEGGFPPKGFNYGNSPVEFSNLDLKNKGIILKTTNGTKSFFKTIGSRGAFVVSLLNLSYASRALVNEAEKTGSDIFLICSGEKNKTAFDDAYTAGAVISEIRKLKKDIVITDCAAIIENNFYFEKDSLEALKKSTSYRSLTAVGLGEDINMCSNKNIYEITGKLETAKITGLNKNYIETIYKIKSFKINK